MLREEAAWFKGEPYHRQCHPYSFIADGRETQAGLNLFIFWLRGLNKGEISDARLIMNRSDTIDGRSVVHYYGLMGR